VRGPSGINWIARSTSRTPWRLALPTCRVDCRQCGLPRPPDLPAAEPGSQCGAPYDCEFWDRCTTDKPSDWIARLARLADLLPIVRNTVYLREFEFSNGAMHLTQVPSIGGGHLESPTAEELFRRNRVEIDGLLH
jgi:hypothetical protein